MNYSNPWERKTEMAKKALAHSENVQKKYSKQVDNAIKNTSIYDGHIDISSKPLASSPCKIALFQCDSLEGAILLENMGEENIMILNYASYKHPGGMFLKGSIAQEEALCHESILFEVLRDFQEKYYNINKRRLNRSLYTHRALFSKDILFMRNGIQHEFSVLTCAAPNYGSAKKYCNVHHNENYEVLKQRIDFMFKIAIQQNITNIVLGAWGCGVFKQDPNEVASLFMHFADKYKFYFHNIVFAVPNSKNNDNYDAFFNVVVNGNKFC